MPIPCIFLAKRYQIDGSELSGDWQGYEDGKFYTDLKKIPGGVRLLHGISPGGRQSGIGFEKCLDRQPLILRKKSPGRFLESQAYAAILRVDIVVQTSQDSVARA